MGLDSVNEVPVPVIVDEFVTQFREWRGKSVSAKPLSCGLTNSNNCVEVDGTPYGMRISGVSTELLAVDRTNEYYNTRAVGEAGVPPQVVHYWGWATDRWKRGMAMMNAPDFEA
jgi:hypothetical protein